ncbi:hypothetical protein ACX8Z9_04395 [Arthrobacter halodurans]|uniref:Uncharacterized protein n=1 Tax=Arthrobacter halodurans TaxID=516699 RepID=A0ABV4UJX1_9MICC
MMNQDYTNTSFRSSHVHITAHNYLGNDISVPAGSRAGENCLLGTKVGIPIDGPVRTGVGLLGSPAFEIPRTVERDRQFDGLDPADASGLPSGRSRCGDPGSQTRGWASAARNR